MDNVASRPIVANDECAADAAPRRRPDGWLVAEGIVTTRNPDGTTNVAPMGPLVDPAMTRFILRPFRTATTYANLIRTGEAVFHVTDDVELLARAAVGRLDTPPPLSAVDCVDVTVLDGACRWYALKLRSADDRDERSWIGTDVVERRIQREFFGFNRAKHAVLEAAILATRGGLLATAEILAEFERFAVIVEKTGGDDEQRAFSLLDSFVRDVGTKESGARESG
ncbi:MAG: DUF447 family protein [Pirellulales bacterium]